MMTKDNFMETMTAIWSELNDLHEQEQELTQQMEQLQKAGMTQATIHTRSDNGGMELLHATGSDYEKQTGRRREYIGKKEDAQAEARARVERYKTYQKLHAERRIKQDKINSIKYQIGRLEMTALGRQSRLFSDVGTIDEPGSSLIVPNMGTHQVTAARCSVPKNWDWLSPQMVIDYFRQSTDLAGMTDDVKEVLSKVIWAELKAA